MMGRGVTLEHVTELFTEDCCSCGVLFAMPTDLMNRRRADKKSFWCPNGHSMSYDGETDAAKAKKAREELARVQKQLELSQRSAAYTQQQLETTRRERTVLKGQLTRTRKRVANGVCPCCNRSFADLHRHMSSQHPDFAVEAVEVSV